ncbi:MAG TPA: hypothetical protein VKP10_08655 [Gemmatimonadales bacterium]|nr:hypothetical protein [Gemmatimonadales bacterium]
MTDERIAKLHALLSAYAERQAAAKPAPRAVDSTAERKRRACADLLRTVVRPVLERFMEELKQAGHDASTRDHTDRDDAYPSVALSFTPRSLAAAKSPESVLASALMFKYDPRRGIVVQRDVKLSPAKGRVAPAGDRTGTIGVDAVSTEWVATKALSFVEDVLKAN